MDRVTDLCQYLNILNSFKRGHKKYETNNFLSLEYISKLLAAQIVYFQAGPLYLNILVKRKEFSSLYFYTESIRSLSIPKEIDNLVYELFGSESEVYPQARGLAEKGLAIYDVYYRMTLNHSDFPKLEHGWNKPVHNTTNTSGDIVYNAILKEFDVISDRIPSRDEFDEYLRNNHLILDIDDLSGEITGFIIYSLNGMVSAIEYIVVFEKYRNKKIAKILLSRYLNHLKSSMRKFELWVNNRNFIAIKLYEDFNYKKDKIIKCVLTDRSLFMKKKLLEALRRVNSEIGYNLNANFIQEGIIDSFDIMNIVRELETSFHIELDAEDVIVENFETFDAIEKMVLSKMISDGK